MNLELLASAGAVALACALGGVFLVLRRSAMLADAVSHAILPGLVAAYAISGGSNLAVGMAGAAAASLVTIGSVNWLTGRGILKDDAAIGLVFPTLFALGMLLISLFFRGVHLDADSVLFGEIAFAPLERVSFGGADLGPRAAWVGGILVAAQLVYLKVFGYEMGAMTFDPQGSRAAGARRTLVQGTGMVLLSVTAAAAFSAAGAVMATALLVMPTVAAGLWTRRFWPLVWAACGVAGAATMGGTWAAALWDLSVSGWIVAVLFVLVLGSALAAPGRGLISGALYRARQRKRFAGEMLVVHLASHEGTAGEALESTFDHLVEELGWDGDQAALAVGEAVRRGAVVNERGALRLTEEGRRWAAKLDTRQI